MSIFLSSGPILEPMIGMVSATISCIGILIFSMIKFLKSEKFKKIKTQSTADQWIDFVPIIIIASISLFILWWILMFVFAGIINNNNLKKDLL